MKFKDILKKVGSSIIKEVIPGGGLVVDLVNGFLPDDKKLPAGATGAEIQTAVDALPPDVRATLLSKEMDVETEEIRSWTSVVDSLAKSDATGNSTRPEIAKMMAYAVCAAVYAFVACWLFAVFNDSAETLKAVKDSWPAIVAILGTPTLLLRAYFGMRTKEKTARYNMASGQSGGLGVVGGLVKAFAGRG